MVAKMTMPAPVTDARSMPRVLTDNLFVEKQPGLSETEVREALETWLNVEDDPQMLNDEVGLEMQALEEDRANLGVEHDVSGEEEDGSGMPESCITSSITEAEVHSRFEEVRSYLYAKERDGEYNETQYLLSKAVHSFTHETQVIKCRRKELGEVQATIRDLWKKG